MIAVVNVQGYSYSCVKSCHVCIIKVCRCYWIASFNLKLLNTNPTILLQSECEERFLPISNLCKHTHTHTHTVSHTHTHIHTHAHTHTSYLCTCKHTPHNILHTHHTQGHKHKQPHSVTWFSRMSCATRPNTRKTTL